MFRKTFIRLALLVIIVSAGLIVYATTKLVNQANKQSCEAKTDCAPDNAKGDFFILESLGRSILSTGKN